MELFAIEFIRTFGPYALVVLFTVAIYRMVQRHRQEIGFLHSKTMDAFDKQASAYERIHLDIVKRNDAKDAEARHSESVHKKGR